MFWSKSNFLKLCLFFVVVSISIASTHKQLEETIISGKIEGVEDQWAVVRSYDVANFRVDVIDSFHISNEQFMFNLNVDKCRRISFSIEGNDRKLRTTSFYVDEGASIDLYGTLDTIVTNDAIKLSVKGSKTQEEAIEATALDKKRFLDMGNMEQYINENPASLLSGSLLFKFVVSEKMFKNVDELQGKQLYNLLSSDVQDSYYGKKVEQEILKFDNTRKGGEMFDFNALDINNNPIRLSEIKRKYIIVNFWATWMVDKQNLINLKEIYNKYHNSGLEIVSFAGDTDGQKSWKRAIDSEEIDAWKHIFVTRENRDIYEKFDNRFTRSIFLLDEDRNILMRVNEDKFHEFSTYLDELFEE